MNAQHTPGRIRYDYEPGYCGELLRANGTSLCSFADEPTEDDARRLVACWNACEGVSTENLEDNAPVKTLATRYNELLAAAPRMVDALKRAAHILAEIDQSTAPAVLALRTEIVAAIKDADPSHYGSAA